MIPISEIDLRFKEFTSVTSGTGQDGDLITSAIHLEEFLTTIFPIQNQLANYRIEAANFNIIYKFKRNFVQRRALRLYPSSDIIHDADFSNMSTLALAIQVFKWLEDEEKYTHELDRAAKYCAYKVQFDPDSIIFQMPDKLDFDHLVSMSSLPAHTPVELALDQSHYCIFCHKQSKDSCRSGLYEAGKIKTNPIGNELAGCPLGQKISEMNFLYSMGNIIAALAVVMIDNPLVAATGDRICNDCMKSCIYQKQEPVDIPKIETQMLRDVLRLPFGAEIYYLLSRWNPLDAKDTPSSPRRNLVIGLGPAGFAMAYYLLKKGHYVTAIDGLDITPLPEVFFAPIENWPALIDSLGSYKSQGFGGVAEYGITDRWDKYNLLLIRMLLERYPNFKMKGNMRLGRDITLKKAIEEEGYDYVALCLGAGAPKVPDIKNIDAKNVISAFSFLASLHMNKPNFEYTMPVVIIGAGLTAMDCAMAALKYSNDPRPDITILYRKSMQESPSYRENHHELEAAMKAGVKFIYNTDLKSIEVDANQQIASINQKIPAKTLIYSIGTHPNDKIFKSEAEAFKLYKDKIGIFGDMDPTYAGTVVKAIASIKNWTME